MTPTVLLLSDGGPDVAGAAEALRAQGFRVLATAHAPEFERRLNDPDVCMAAGPARLLVGRAAIALRRARAQGASTRPEFVALTDPGVAPPEFVDLAAADADGLCAAAWRIGADRGLPLAAGPAVYRNGTSHRTVEEPAPPPKPAYPPAAPAHVHAPAAPARDCAARTARLAENARRLTELESDVDRLLDVALDAFLETAGADRGSLLLAPEEGVLEAVRRSGYRDDDEAAELEAAAAEIARRVAPHATRAADGSLVFGVPWLEGRAVLGVVCARVRGALDEGDRTAAELCARQAAANYANARRLDDLRRMAVIDPLTGLFNRRFFERQLRVEIERARRHRRHVTLAIIDVDGFKRFNGANGYDVGDQVIRETAELLKGNFREIDVVTRWGGDEFAVILPETHRAALAAAAGAPSERGRPAHFVDRVRKAVEEHRFRACPTGRVTISAGVAAFPGDAADAKGLFQSANQALLEAKRTGHNRVVLSGPEGFTASAEA